MIESLLIESRVRLNPLAPISTSELKRIFQAILKAIDAPCRGLEVKLVSDSDMAELHGRFLAIPGPTNVLSFPPRSTEDGLGSLVLSVDTLTREAHLYGQDIREHLVRLLTHGILHLMGMDHGQAMDLLIERACLAVLAD